MRPASIAATSTNSTGVLKEAMHLHFGLPERSNSSPVDLPLRAPIGCPIIVELELNRRLLDACQAFAAHSRESSSLASEIGRQVALLIPGAAGYLIFPASAATGRRVTSFGHAGPLGKVIPWDDSELPERGAVPLPREWADCFPNGTTFVTAARIGSGQLIASLPERRASGPLLELVDTIASLAGIHWVNALAHEEDARRIHYLEQHDTVVTQLPNQRFFDQLAKDTLGHETASLILLDLDGFKQANEKLGYREGDRLLSEIARRWKEFVATHQPSATLARMGGDEFVVLLPASGQKEAVCLAAGMLEDLLNTPVLGLAGLTASAGLSGPYEGHDMVETLQRDAELAMFKAKKEGGNRLAISPGKAHPTEE